MIYDNDILYIAIVELVLQSYIDSTVNLITVTMMRTIVDIPEHQIEQLAQLGKEQNKSRAELIRQAIAKYLENYSEQESQVFGIWSNRQEDGLSYQEKLREEWD